LDSIRRESGAEPLCRARDVADERFIDRWVEETLDHFGAIDVLINNAGVLTPRGPLSEIVTADWDETMRVNSRGPFLSMRRVLPLMIARRSGCVINVTSGAGKRARARGGPYSVSKFGVEGLTRIAAAEAAESGVRVNALSPEARAPACVPQRTRTKTPSPCRRPTTLRNFFFGWPDRNAAQTGRRWSTGSGSRTESGSLICGVRCLAIYRAQTRR
jgi:NAD(P)-dependent dehydrogenase (short-subunit alcohol dehydrogenase family)